MRKVPTKCTAHFASYHPDAKVSSDVSFTLLVVDSYSFPSSQIHAVITSEDQICQVIPKMSGDETITLESVERGMHYLLIKISPSWCLQTIDLSILR